jgi:hypothetical protein
MPALTNQRRKELLELLHNLGAGQEEKDPDKVGAYLYPVPEHLRALEPDVVLIVGDRGAGKSQLKDVLVSPPLREALIRRAPRIRIPSGEARWLEGWPLGSRGPDSRSWRAFAGAATQDEMVDAWLAFLIRCLAESLPASEAKQTLASTDPLDVRSLVTGFAANHRLHIGALDQLDAELEASDRWMFVAYDELDTVVSEDWKALGQVVRGLVSMWAAYARRWRRIRPKVFLRTDFYRHNREIAGADVIKLSANRVDLTWSDKNLYGVLVKRILNRDTSLFEHFRSAIATEPKMDPALGRMPVLSTAQDARPFVTRLAGEYMGKNNKKGETFKWLLDHLRDGTERLSPRVLLWLVEEAARGETDDMRARGSQLIAHVAIRRALDRVSDAFVAQAATNELKWMSGLRRCLALERQVPWNRKQLDGLLRNGFGISWGSDEGGAGTANVRPPGETVDEVRDNLVELGILRERGDKTFDVPDLYLHGLGLIRKGGVAQS